MIAGVTKTEAVSGRDHGVVDPTGELRGDVQLPAQLAHVSHAGGAHRRRGEPDLLRREKRERRVREVGVGEPGEELARARPHDAQRRLARGDVSEHGSRLPEVAPDPMRVVRRG